MQNFEEIFNSTKVIAILRNIPSDKLTKTLDALYAGGIRLAEITYDRTGATSDSETAKNIARAVKYTEGKMLIGAGTVLTCEQVELTKKAGGKFIISPDTCPEVIKATKENGLLSLPGAMTMSEVCTALRAGADFVKLFPCDVLGIGFIKALLAPLRGTKLIAVSGISPENAGEYIAAGCVGIGVGSGIANAKLCNEGKYDVITERAKAYVEACK